jgi:hypothetical protein
MRGATIHVVSNPTVLVEICINADKYKLRRGDIIVDKSASGYGYRSCGMYFFNGRLMIDQCREYDDYGTLPREFGIITEFPPGYWDLSDNKMYGDSTCDDSAITHHTTYEYLRGVDKIKVLTTSSVDISWHEAENRGTSIMTIGEEYICSGGIILEAKVKVIEYKQQSILIIDSNIGKYALVTELTVAEAKKKIKSEIKWLVLKYLRNGKVNDIEMINLIYRSEVDKKNILYSY